MNSSDGYDLLRKGASGFGIDVSEDQWNRFFEYMRLLQDWNTRMNLTSITDDAAIITKHFVDSLTVAPYIKDGLKGSAAKTLCDIGTGAGFPGIPLKIMFPDLHVILVDSLNKRLLFLDEVISKLGLTKIETVHMRAEDFGRDNRFRNRIDYSTARAVAPMNVLLELCTPVLRVGGEFLAMKGGRDEGSFENAAKKLSCRLEKTDRLTITTVDGELSEKEEAERIIYIFKKTSPTAPAYPRKAGIPSKNPL